MATHYIVSYRGRPKAVGMPKRVGSTRARHVVEELILMLKSWNRKPAPQIVWRFSGYKAEMPKSPATKSVWFKTKTHLSAKQKQNN
jgi:hypothetical protein